MASTADIERHEAAFGRPLREAKTRADWWLAHYRKNGGLQNALMFDRAAEEHQRAAAREAASRRYLGIAPE